MNISKNPPKKLFQGEGEEEAEDPSESYNVREGMQINFAYGHTQENLDTSIGIIEHHYWGEYDVELSEFNHNGKKEEQFDPFLWDSQFQRYAQVLDTDYDNYMVLYECLESAYYLD